MLLPSHLFPPPCGYICTVLQQFVSSERPRAAPVGGTGLLTIGYLQALPGPALGRVVSRRAQVLALRLTC